MTAKRRNAKRKGRNSNEKRGGNPKKKPVTLLTIKDDESGNFVSVGSPLDVLVGRSRKGAEAFVPYDILCNFKDGYHTFETLAPLIQALPKGSLKVEDGKKTFLDYLIYLLTLDCAAEMPLELLSEVIKRITPSKIRDFLHEKNGMISLMDILSSTMFERKRAILGLILHAGGYMEQLKETSSVSKMAKICKFDEINCFPWDDETDVEQFWQSEELRSALNIAMIESEGFEMAEGGLSIDELIETKERVYSGVSSSIIQLVDNWQGINEVSIAFDKWRDDLVEECDQKIAEHSTNRVKFLFEYIENNLGNRKAWFQVEAAYLELQYNQPINKSVYDMVIVDIPNMKSKIEQFLSYDANYPVEVLEHIDRIMVIQMAILSRDKSSSLSRDAYFPEIYLLYARCLYKQEKFHEAHLRRLGVMDISSIVNGEFWYVVLLSEVSPCDRRIIDFFQSDKYFPRNKEMGLFNTDICKKNITTTLEIMENLLEKPEEFNAEKAFDHLYAARRMNSRKTVALFKQMFELNSHDAFHHVRADQALDENYTELLELCKEIYHSPKKCIFDFGISEAFIFIRDYKVAIEYYTNFILAVSSNFPSPLTFGFRTLIAVLKRNKCLIHLEDSEEAMKFVGTMKGEDFNDFCELRMLCLDMGLLALHKGMYEMGKKILEVIEIENSDRGQTDNFMTCFFPADISFEELIQVCYKLMAKKDYDLLLKVVDTASVFHFNHEDFFVMNLIKAKVYRAERRLDDAILACKECLEQNPEYAEAYFEMGLSQMICDKTEDARVSFSKCLDLNPKHLNAPKILKRIEIETNSKIADDKALANSE